MVNMNQLMKQAQAMQQKMTAAQEQLATTEYQGSSGGDMVKVTINGRGEMHAISINKSLLNESEKEVLEDLIVAAFNKAKKAADDASQNSMQDMMGGLGLPPGFKLPF